MFKLKGFAVLAFVLAGILLFRAQQDSEVDALSGAGAPVVRGASPAHSSDELRFDVEEAGSGRRSATASRATVTGDSRTARNRELEDPDDLLTDPSDIGHDEIGEPLNPDAPDWLERQAPAVVEIGQPLDPDADDWLEQQGWDVIEIGEPLDPDADDWLEQREGTITEVGFPLDPDMPEWEGIAGDAAWAGSSEVVRFPSGTDDSD